MRSPLLACALAASLVFAVAGCKRPKSDSSSSSAQPPKGPTLDDVITEYKPKLEPKLASALKIGANLPKPTTHDAIKVEKGPIVMLAADTAAFAKGSDAGGPANATIVHAEDLRGDLTTRSDQEYGMGEKLLLDCAAVLHKKTPVTSDFSPTRDVKETARVLAQCTSFVYLLVIRIANKATPTADTGSHTFQAGHVEGDILVFDIDSGKHLGGYKFSARNSHDLKLDVSDPVRGLEKEIRDKMWAQIRDTFEKLVPGSAVRTAY